MRVAVIGAGPSGLVTLKYLLAAPKALGADAIEVRLFESEPEIGGTFRARTYEDAELVSSRQLTTFSDFRVPQENDFLSAPRYVKYLKDYCTHFQLWSHLQCSCAVQSVEKRQNGGYRVTYLAKDLARYGVYSWECDAVAVCSGLHVTPNVPHIEGIEKVPLKLHSSEFKRREQLGVDKTVLILGSGETASDIGYLAVTAPTKRVVLCHRNGFHLAPKTNPEPRLIGTSPRKSSDPSPVPIDVSRASIFDTAYLHPWLRNSMLLWYYYDFYVALILWLSWGTTDGMDQWIGGKPPGWSTREVFFNKSPNIGPYINNAWKPERPQTWLQHVHSWIVNRPTVDTHGRRVDIAPWPELVDKEGNVVFRDNGRPEYPRMRDEVIRPDVVVYCTGYNRAFPFLKGSAHEIPDVREIWNRDDPSMGFIGFVRPNLGAIPPLSEMQAQLWVLNLFAPEKVGALKPEDEQHYRLSLPKSARIQYGVDHESYVYQLALDMHSAPSISDFVSMAWKGPREQLWRLPLVWALGANFVTKFRLLGPWRWDGAEEVMTDELWETVTRRPIFFGHITLSVIPILIFGPLNLAAFLLSSLVDAFRRVYRLY